MPSLSDIQSTIDTIEQEAAAAKTYAYVSLALLVFIAFRVRPGAR